MISVYLHIFLASREHSDNIDSQKIGDIMQRNMKQIQVNYFNIFQNSIPTATASGIVLSFRVVVVLICARGVLNSKINAYYTTLQS